MGRISKRHQQELDAIAKKAIETWQWELGTDVNPARVEREELDDAYEAVREAIRYDLDGIAKRAGTVGHSESYLRGSLFPKIWLTLAERGELLDFEGGSVIPATATTLRLRLLKADQEARQLFDGWQRANTSQRYEKRVKKQTSQILWNAEVFEEMTDLASGWLAGKSDCKSEKQDLAQRLLAICWFTGRRPWIEAATGAEFRLAEGETWADGWIEFTGRGKLTLEEKEGGAEQIFTIPLFGIEAEEFLAGFQTFRALEAQHPWFRPEMADRNEHAKQALEYSCQGLVGSKVQTVFEPVLEAGYQVAFTEKGRAKASGGYCFEMKTFRQLYASQGHYRHQRWCLDNGRISSNINGYAKRYIGHFGLRSEQDTAEYLIWTYLGDRDIPALQG